ncbi:MAG: lasso peptide biosynthesis B2 protein [Acidobacteria bacterium]|nr:lasso peptide biosynthesis B2 protein [Acidobacteriota bacterium]
MSATEPPLWRRVVQCARALPVVAAVRVALWCLPLGWLCSFASRQHRLRETDAHAIVRGVSTASRFVPCASCLVQALSAQILLARAGIPATLRLGARKDAGGAFQAHAWLEWRGENILGDAGESYAVMRGPLDKVPPGE